MISTDIPINSWNPKDAKYTLEDGFTFPSTTSHRKCSSLDPIVICDHYTPPVSSCDDINRSDTFVEEEIGGRHSLDYFSGSKGNEEALASKVSVHPTSSIAGSKECHFSINNSESNIHSITPEEKAACNHSSSSSSGHTFNSRTELIFDLMRTQSVFEFNSILNYSMRKSFDIDKYQEMEEEDEEEESEESGIDCGISIGELSQRHRVILIFVRHLGCMFTRETLLDICKDYMNLIRLNTQPVIVHMESSKQARNILRNYAKEFNEPLLNHLLRVDDSLGHFARHFRVRDADSFYQIYSPYVITRALLKVTSPGGKLSDLIPFWKSKTLPSDFCNVQSPTKTQTPSHLTEEQIFNNNTCISTKRLPLLLVVESSKVVYEYRFNSIASKSCDLLKLLLLGSITNVTCNVEYSIYKYMKPVPAKKNRDKIAQSPWCIYNPMSKDMKFISKYFRRYSESSAMKKVSSSNLQKPEFGRRASICGPCEKIAVKPNGEIDIVDASVQNLNAEKKRTSFKSLSTIISKESLTLEDILYNRKYRNCFKFFAAKEYDLCPILFWETMQRFYFMCNKYKLEEANNGIATKEMAQLVHQMVMAFFFDDGFLRLHIPHHIITNFKTKYQEKGPILNLFDDVAAEIDIQLKNLFSLFKTSRIFQDEMPKLIKQN